MKIDVWHWKRFIDGIQIPNKDAKGYVIDELFNGKEVLEPQTMNDRIENLKYSIEWNLTAGFDKLYNLSGYEARRLWETLQRIFNTPNSFYELLLTNYDEGFSSRDDVLRCIIGDMFFTE